MFMLNKFFALCHKEFTDTRTKVRALRLKASLVSEYNFKFCSNHHMSINCTAFVDTV